MIQADDYLLAARAAIDAGDFRRAYMLVTGAMQIDPTRSDLYLAAGESLRWLGQTRLADLYEAAALRTPGHDTVLELAQEILATGDAPLAVDIARRAVDLNRGSLPALGLLALALAADFRPAEGRALLIDYRGLEFDQAFVRAWCALLCGEVDSVLRFVEDTRMDLQRVPVDSATRTSRETWTQYMEDCLARRGTVAEPLADVRAWHFIQYGAAIMTESPDLATAGGRFTATWKGYREVTAILKALYDLLIRTNRRPALVLPAPGRDSSILARVASALLDVPFHEATDAHVHAEGALIVASRGSDLAGLPVEITRRGQTVFAFDFNWLTPGHVVPDICGMLSLSCTLPWQSETRMAMSAVLPGARHVAAEAEIVRRLLQAEGDTSASAVNALPFYAERAWDLKGHRPAVRRERFRRDSPVATLHSWRGYV